MLSDTRQVTYLTCHTTFTSQIPVTLNKTFTSVLSDRRHVTSIWLVTRVKTFTSVLTFTRVTLPTWDLSQAFHQCVVWHRHVTYLYLYLSLSQRLPCQDRISCGFAEKGFWVWRELYTWMESVVLHNGARSRSERDERDSVLLEDAWLVEGWGAGRRGGGRGKVRLADNQISAEAVCPLVKVQIGCNCQLQEKEGSKRLHCV